MAETIQSGSSRRGLRLVLNLVLGLLALIVVGFLARTFVASTYPVGGSMEQTLHRGDRVVVDKLSYRFQDVRRGDVILFDGAGSFDPGIAPPSSGLGVEVVPGRHKYIKRVVGIPGDTVACCTAGRVTVNGHELDERYVTNDDDPIAFDAVTVAPGQLFVMGDDRDNSADSRAHGTVPDDQVVGRVALVLSPEFRVLDTPELVPGQPTSSLRGLLSVVGAVLVVAAGLAVVLPRRRSRRAGAA